MTSISPDSYLTVRRLTSYLKRKFDADPHLRRVYVKGELSNVKLHTSGHIYFTLKDASSRIPGVLFSQQAKKLKFTPESGMNVLVRGEVNIYEASGQYQLYAVEIEPDGVGALYIAYEQLKEKLRAEGLFDPARKKALPAFPEEIGLVTAPTGAAIRDVLSTLARRYPLARVTVFPATVQGAKAAPSLAAAIGRANAHPHLDVLLVCRGGGSIEDLWAFNEELVARAMAASRVPIIAGVGHETDTTIADYVADRRAPTPTAAAELAAPDRAELLQALLQYRPRLQAAASQSVARAAQRAVQLRDSAVLRAPERLYRPFVERLVVAEERLQAAAEALIDRRATAAEFLEQRLRGASPAGRIRFELARERELAALLTRAAQSALAEKTYAFRTAVRTLDALSPLKTMERGFGVVEAEGAIISSAKAVGVGDAIAVRLRDGSLLARVTDRHLERSETR